MNEPFDSLNGDYSAVVMVVDDEEMVTTSLAAYLHLETDYAVLTFQSPKEALKSLEKSPVDIIISDFLMPDMDGLQFLDRARKLYPNLTCILLTGYADKENAIKAINEVGLFQYIEKPWDNDNLRLIIRNGIATKNLREVLSNKIRELDKVLLERDTLFQDNEMFKSELLLARNVQESLLPEELPDINGFSMVAKYLPALEVGGDFYDVVPLADEKIALLLADVTGHGIQAALITVLLKATLAEFKEKETTPGKILTFMNKTLFEVLPQNLYVAALAVVIDTKTSTCKIVNGGVPHPYHIRRAEDAVERIPANGLLLGVADGETFTHGEEVLLQLQKGDAVILYTDGLSEAENKNDEHFEEELMDTLYETRQKSGDKIIEHLIDSAKTFSKKNHKWDDVTILGIECK